MEHLFNWTPYVLSVVIERDPEHADISNPRGEIVRDRWFPMLEDARGNRVIGEPFEDVEDCCDRCSWLNAYHIIPSPADRATWPAYLSPAWVTDNAGEDEEFVPPTVDSKWSS